MTADWPPEAREAAHAAAINEASFGQEATTIGHIVDAVLKALSDHVQPRSGVTHRLALLDLADDWDDFGTPQRLLDAMRALAGEWEVAP